MPIHALSQPTTNYITSTSLLTSPVSAVKELIDNALDTHATSISIHISANTVDSIQVRDDGLGIEPLDRRMVGKRYCTSKIGSMEDLEKIGSKACLGFRGEAVASLVECAKSVVVTTRVAGEKVAVRWSLERGGGGGGAGEHEPASHPIGTTIHVTDFFHAFPVRRREAVKHAATHLNSIKRLLYGYALARPGVRLAMQVTGGDSKPIKTTNANWVYAPNRGGGSTPTTEDAAFKVAGSACASQCLWTEFEADGYAIRAVVAKSDADIKAICNQGQFMSIDKRPISVKKGLFKDVVEKYKDKLKMAAAAAAEGGVVFTVKDPFLCLDLGCPPAAYDVNIEPAKDDVVFADAPKVLALFEGFLEKCYPTRDSKREREEDGDEEPFEGGNVMLHDQEASQRPHKIKEDWKSTVGEMQTPEKNAWSSDMSGYDKDLEMLLSEADTALNQPGNKDGEGNELAELEDDVTTSNPWTLTRLNMSIKSPQKKLHDLGGSVPTTQQLLTPPKSTPLRERADRTPLHDHGRGQARLQFSPAPSQLTLTPGSPFKGNIPVLRPTPQNASPPPRTVHNLPPTPTSSSPPRGEDSSPDQLLADLADIAKTLKSGTTAGAHSSKAASTSFVPREVNISPRVVATINPAVRNSTVNKPFTSPLKQSAPTASKSSRAGVPLIPEITITPPRAGHARPVAVISSDDGLLGPRKSMSMATGRRRGPRPSQHQSRNGAASSQNRDQWTPAVDLTINHVPPPQNRDIREFIGASERARGQEGIQDDGRVPLASTIPSTSRPPHDESMAAAEAEDMSSTFARAIAKRPWDTLKMKQSRIDSSPPSSGKTSLMAGSTVPKAISSTVDPGTASPLRLSTFTHQQARHDLVAPPSPDRSRTRIRSPSCRIQNLPLERIPDGQRLHNMYTVVHVHSANTPMGTLDQPLGATGAVLAGGSGNNASGSSSTNHQTVFHPSQQRSSPLSSPSVSAFREISLEDNASAGTVLHTWAVRITDLLLSGRVSIENEYGKAGSSRSGNVSGDGNGNGTDNNQTVPADAVFAATIAIEESLRESLVGVCVDTGGTSKGEAEEGEEDEDEDMF